MSNLVYDLAVAPILHSLKALDAIISKAEAYADADDDIDSATIAQARLYPNMRPLIFQIQVATDTAKGAAARLAGKDVPSWADDEATIADIHLRLNKTIDYLSSCKPEEYEGGENRAIHLQIGPHAVDFTGTSYIASFVLPNFYFHMTTAYNILRHNGVVIGKGDFLGMT